MIRDVQIDPARSASSAQELAGEGALAIAGLSLTSTHMPVYNAMAKVNVPVVTGFPAHVGVVLPPKARSGVYGAGLAFEIPDWVGGHMDTPFHPSVTYLTCPCYHTP